MNQTLPRCDLGLILVKSTIVANKKAGQILSQEKYVKKSIDPASIFVLVFATTSHVFNVEKGWLFSDLLVFVCVD